MKDLCRKTNVEYKFYSKLLPFYFLIFFLLWLTILIIYRSAGTDNFIEYHEIKKLVLSEDIRDGELDLSEKEYNTLPDKYPYMKNLIGKDEVSERDFNDFLKENEDFKKSLNSINEGRLAIFINTILLIFQITSVFVVLLKTTLDSGKFLDFITLFAFFVVLYLSMSILLTIVILFLINTFINILNLFSKIIHKKNKKRKILKAFEYNLK